MTLRNTVGSLVLLLLSLLFSAAVLEASLRVMGYGGAPLSVLTNTYSVPDPVLDWRYRPNSQFQIGPVVYKFNRAGFRDIDHRTEKPAGTSRVVVLGDSVTEGYGVKASDMFTTLVRRGLGDGWETINLAAGGLNTEQQVHLLEQDGLVYGPDLVVVNFVMNDPDAGSRRAAATKYDAEKASRIGLLGIPIDPQVKQALKSSALLYFVKERVEHLAGMATGRQNTDYYSTLLRSDAGRHRVAAALDRLQALRAAHGFEVVVVVWPILADYGNYRFRFAHEWIGGEVDRRGFARIDLLAPFSRESHRRLQVTAEDNIHPNGIGHRIGADTFLAWHRARPRS